MPHLNFVDVHDSQLYHRVNFCSQAFEQQVQYRLLKEMLTQIFSTPYNHPKSQPFVDNVYTFSLTDNRIWFRNYQIVEENGSLAEIGMSWINAYLYSPCVEH